MKKKYCSHLLLVICVASFFAFFYLGNLSLLDPDEPVYAETAREMIQFHDYISPRIYGEFWYDKPPMYYWLVAGAFKAFGEEEFAARFPSALLAVGGTLLVYFAGRELFNRRTGLIAALILASSLEYIYLAKAAVTDITLTFFMTASLFAFLHKRYYWFYGCAALAVVTKGPIGIVFPAGIVFLYLLVTKKLAELREMKLVTGGLLFSAIVLPWYLMMYQLHGQEFISTFLGFHNLTRFTQPEHPEGTLWYYYIPVLILGFFPWSAYVLSAFGSLFSVKNERIRSTLVFLTIWAAVVFVFFTISQTKLVSYILPMYPPLAMIVGWSINKMWSAGNRSAFFKSAGILTVLVFIWEAALVYAGKKMTPALLPGATMAGIIFFLMLIAVWWASYQRRFAQVVAANVIGMLLFVIVLMTQLFPAAEAGFSMREFSNDFQHSYDGKSPVYVAKFYRPGLMFYTGIPGQEIKTAEQLMKALDQSQKSYFVINKKQYKQLPEDQQAKLQLIYELEDKVLLVHEN